MLFSVLISLSTIFKVLIYTKLHVLRNHVITKLYLHQKSITESENRQTVESVHLICNLYLCYNFALVLHGKCTHFQLIRGWHYLHTLLGCNITIIDPVLPYGLTCAVQIQLMLDVHIDSVPSNIRKLFTRTSNIHTHTNHSSMSHLFSDKYSRLKTERKAFLTYWCQSLE